MSSRIQLRSGAWYGDRQIELEIPSDWELNVHRPHTPPPLTDAQIESSLDRPDGQTPVRNLCKGKSRPLIIVDDLNRPTPADRVVGLLLKYFSEAGLPPERVTVLMATGTHGDPAPDAMSKKIGVEAAARCRTIIHNCFRGAVRMGTSSFGTPVYVNKAVAESDFVIGIGGLNPNHTAGFGGGSKLALGVLGIRSIFRLHFGHPSAGWGSDGTESTFRRDINEIAEMIGLRTVISLHVDENREIVAIQCGDSRKYFPAAVKFCRDAFAAPSPGDADVVISDAYPNDLSLTFARMKGFVPLQSCKAGASRVVIASLPEGVGLHNLFPFVNVPRFHRQRHRLRRLSMMTPRQVASAVFSKVSRTLTSSRRRSGGSNGQGPESGLAFKNPIRLFRPGNQTPALASAIGGIQLTSSWEEIIQAIKSEQNHRTNLKVVVYPCAFLQSLQPSTESTGKIPITEHSGE
ncbi:MAG TPA: lactate racemase domain-containing protein [Bacteroidota bacterium]|nr:lactate racemase domain-containing protein [Bacteroidota bacterium]